MLSYMVTRQAPAYEDGGTASTIGRYPIDRRSMQQTARDIVANITLTHYVTKKGIHLPLRLGHVLSLIYSVLRTQLLINPCLGQSLCDRSEHYLINDIDYHRFCSACRSSATL